MRRKQDVARPGDDQGGHPDGRQHAAHVNLEPLPGHGRRRSGAGGHPLHLRVPPAEAVITSHRRIGQPQVGAGAPGAQDSLGVPVDVGLRHALLISGACADPRVTAHQDERLDAFGMGGGEHQGGRAAPQHSQDHRPVAARLVENRAHVVHLLVHCGRGPARLRIRQPHAAVVVHNEPGERRQPVQAPRQRAVHPHEVDVRGGAGLDHDQVHRTLTYYLIREMHRAVARVAGLRRIDHHRCLVSTASRLIIQRPPDPSRRAGDHDRNGPDVLKVPIATAVADATQRPLEPGTGRVGPLDDSRGSLHRHARSPATQHLARHMDRTGTGIAARADRPDHPALCRPQRHCPRPNRSA